MQTPYKPAAIGQGRADALGQPLRRLGIRDDVFNGRLRDELLNETLFTSLTLARLAPEDWRRDYNTVRPHSRIGWPTQPLMPSNSHRNGPRRCAARWLRALTRCYVRARWKKPSNSSRTWIKLGGNVTSLPLC